MNLKFKTLSLIASALAISGSMYALQGCHKREIGTEKTTVANANRKTGNGEAVVASTAKPSPEGMATATPAFDETASSGRVSAKKKAVDTGEQVHQAYATTEPRTLAARPAIEVTKGGRAEAQTFFAEEEIAVKRNLLEERDFKATGGDLTGGIPRPNKVISDRVPPLSLDPSELIAEASELLEKERPSKRLSPIGPRGAAVGAIIAAIPSPHWTSPGTYARAAVERAQRALDLINQRSEPTDAELKMLYLNTKRAALEIRMEALSLLASGIDRTQAAAAENAYHEYIAAEPDAAKVAQAENDLAAMLYDTGQLEKAKIAYRQVLANQPRNITALASLHMIWNTLATEQEAAGRLTEAKTSFAAAAEYAKRLRAIDNADRQSIEYVTGCRFR